MKTVERHLETGFAGCNHCGEIEIADDATDKEIDEAVREEVFNFVSWGWEKKAKASSAA